MNDIKINILTRTSNRPKYFERCINSIKNQTYKNINHLISVDNDSSEEYVKKYTNNYIRVNRIDVKLPLFDITKKRKSAPYNLYLNELRKNITDGWIMFIDDDDMLMNNNVIEELVNKIKNEDQLFLWKVQFPNKIIPEDEFFKNGIIALNHFSMIGFMYNYKYDKFSNFDYFSGGDFYFIKNLLPLIPERVWIDKIYTGIQRKDSMGGFGQRDDLN